MSARFAGFDAAGICISANNAVHRLGIVIGVDLVVFRASDVDDADAGTVILQETGFQRG